MSHLQCGLVVAQMRHLSKIKIMVQDSLIRAATQNVKSSNGVTILCSNLVMVDVGLMLLDARSIFLMILYITNHLILISSHLWSNLQAAESIKRI